MVGNTITCDDVGSGCASTYYMLRQQYRAQNLQHLKSNPQATAINAIITQIQGSAACPNASTGRYTAGSEFDPAIPERVLVRAD